MIWFDLVPFGSFLVLLGFVWFLFVLSSSFGSFWFLLVPFGFFLVPFGSF